MIRVEKCKGCNGTGAVVCPICNGKGEIRKKKGLGGELGMGDQTECQDCHGTGKLLCQLCGGVGKIQVNIPL